MPDPKSLKAVVGLQSRSTDPKLPRSLNQSSTRPRNGLASSLRDRQQCRRWKRSTMGGIPQTPNLELYAVTSEVSPNAEHSEPPNQVPSLV